jgi:hypothetical protein
MINASRTPALSDAVQRAIISSHPSHQPWCDPAEHALTASAYEDGGDPGCVGRVIEVDGDGQLGGWWHMGHAGTPEFIVDRGFDVDLSAGAVRLMNELLTTPAGTEQLRRFLRDAVNAAAGGTE